MPYFRPLSTYVCSLYFIPIELELAVAASITTVIPIASTSVVIPPSVSVETLREYVSSVRVAGDVCRSGYGL